MSCVGLQPEIVHFGRRLERLIRERENDGTPEGKAVRLRLEKLLSVKAPAEKVSIPS
jgi:hypothetical protein